LLGNLDARRDWGFAGDYVRAMWMMLQHERPQEFVIATGKTYLVREFVEAAFLCAGLDYKKYVKTDPKFLRPIDINILCGDPTRIKNTLGWRPEVDFKKLVEMMVLSDLRLVEKECGRL
jgi:GDPmannose 4,6-dehydratase